MNPLIEKAVERFEDSFYSLVQDEIECSKNGHIEKCKWNEIKALFISELEAMRATTLKEVLDFMDKKGWVYRSEFIQKFITEQL